MVMPGQKQVVVQATKPRGPIAQALRTLGVQVVSIQDDEGNVDRFVISRRLVIERRTSGAFLKGIMDKTLFSEAIYLREHFALPVLVVEGPMNYRYTAIRPEAVRGALSSMVIEYGLNVLSTTDREETCALVAMMATHEQHGIAEISVVPKRTATSFDDQQRRVAEMLPGCGRVAARELLQHFGSIEAIVSASVDELRAIRGIGARKAGDIHRVLHEEYRAVDTERQLEDAIEADPSLLFDRPVRLLGRQHHLRGDAAAPSIVDMVYIDEASRELLLVELKRGVLMRADAGQLRRYLDQAWESSVLRRHLDEGCVARGVLACVEPCNFRSPYDDVSVAIVDRDSVIRVLHELRLSRRLKG